MNSSGLGCEACLVHFKGFIGENEWILIKVCWSL